MKKNISFFILISLITFNCIAQTNAKKKISIGVLDFSIPSGNDIRQSKSLNIYGVSVTSNDQSQEKVLQMKLESIQSIVTQCYVKDNRFTLVDRRTTEATQKERELQKSENFIDGYVVSQGKSIGADYLIAGNFDLKTSKLILTIYSTEDGKIVGKESAELKSGFLGLKSFEEPTQELVRVLNGKVFPLLIPIVEVKEQSKSKVKSILIAGGINRGLKEYMKLDVKLKEAIEVDGEKQTYYKTIGEVQIDKVEDLNFTIVKVIDGGEEIKKNIDNGIKLYCTFKNN